MQVFCNYEIRIERCFVFEKPGPSAGMVIHLDDARYLLIKWGFQVLVRSLLPTNTFTGFLRFEEKIVINRESGLLKTLRRLNGDETRSSVFAMIPNEVPDHGEFPICATIPART